MPDGDLDFTLPRTSAFGGGGGSGSGGGGFPMAASPIGEQDPWQSAPFYREFADNNDYYVRVEWYDPVLGRHVIQGDLPPTCGVESLVRQFKKAGAFRLVLMGPDGFAVTDKTQVIRIAEDHTTLQAIRREAAAGAHGPMLGGMPVVQQAAGPNMADMQAMMETLLAPQRAALEAERKRIDDERAQIRAKETQAEDLTRGAATLLMDRNRAETEHVIKMQAELAAKVTDQQGSAFANLLGIIQAQTALSQQQQQSANDMFLARLTAMQEAERIAGETRAREREADLERRRLEIERERQEREARLQRERDEDHRRMEQERAREREHYERMSKLASEAKDPLATTLSTVGLLVTTAKSAGIDLGGIFEKVVGGGGDGGSIWATLISEGGKTFRSMMETQRALAGAQAQRSEEDDEDDEDDDEESSAVTPPQIAQQPVQPAAPQVPEWARSANAPQPAVTPQPAAQPAPAAVVSRAAAVMPTQDLKKARRAAKQLVATLRKTDEAQWEVTIATAIGGEPALAMYLKVATIRGALSEIGVEAPFAERIIQVVKASGHVPAELIG